MRKNLTGLLVLAIMVLTTSAWTSVYGPVSAAARHSSGIEILGPAAAASPVEQKLLQAWSDALLIAEAYDGLGYPWADTTTGTLVLSTTSPAGEALANQWITSGLTHRNPKVGNLAKPAVPVRLRAVSLSYRQLDAIKFEATQLVAALESLTPTRSTRRHRIGSRIGHSRDTASARARSGWRSWSTVTWLRTAAFDARTSTFGMSLH